MSLKDGTRAGVRPSTLSNMNISETSWPIVIKLHLGHYWSGGLAALGFGPDHIRTLVSMATDSSHRVIMGENLVTTLAPSFFYWFFFSFAGNEDNYKILNAIKIRQDSTRDL